MSKFRTEHRAGPTSWVWYVVDDNHTLCNCATQEEAEQIAEAMNGIVYININRAQAHIIFGALSICDYESVNGIDKDFWNQYKALIEPQENALLSALSFHFPDVARKYQ